MAQIFSNGWSTLWVRRGEPFSGESKPTIVFTLQEYRETARLQVSRKEAKRIVKALKRALKEKPDAVAPLD